VSNGDGLPPSQPTVNRQVPSRTVTTRLKFIIIIISIIIIYYLHVCEKEN